MSNAKLADIISTQNLVPAGAATANSAVEISAQGAGTIGVQTVGTYTGALSAQVTVNGADWITLGGSSTFTRQSTGVASATITSGQQDAYVVNVAGFSGFRVTALAAVTGSVTVTLQAADTGSASAAAAGGGTVDTVVAGSGITVDSTDPANPIVTASALAEATLGAGTTAITRADHLNRPLIVNQAAATTGTFAATATSGALAGDHFYLHNTGAGTFTAGGAITAPPGFKLRAEPGEYFSADYDSVDDSFVSTTAAIGPGWNLLSGSGFLKPAAIGATTVPQGLGMGVPLLYDSGVISALSAVGDGANGYGSIPRARYYAAVAAVNRAGGFVSPTYAKLDHAGLHSGRFPFYAMMAIGDASPTTGSGFAGLIGSVALTLYTGIEPSACTVDHVGIGFDSADANWQIMHNDNAGASTKIDTGIVRAQYDPVMVEINKNTGGTTLYVRVYRWATDTWSAVSTITTNMPRTTIAYHGNVVRGSMAEAVVQVHLDFIGFQAGGKS